MTDADPRRPRSRRALVRVALALVGALAGLVATELWVRAVEPFGIAYYREVPRYLAEAIEPLLGRDGLPAPDGRIFQHRRGVTLEFAGFDLALTAAGLRGGDAAATVAPRAGEPTPGRGGWSRERWLFLGDSVTLGWGVDDRDTWVRLVEREATAADGRPLEALNAGHLMYDTVQEADLLRALGPELRPDVVALCFITNDLEPTHALFRRQLEDAAARTAARGERGAFGHVRARLADCFRGLLTVGRHAQVRTATVDVAANDATLAAMHAAHWERCRAALDELRATAEELGARFVLLDHSMPRLTSVRSWAEARGVDCVRLGFEPSEWERGIVVSAADRHANALGNRIIADKVLAGLRARGYLR